MQQTRDIQENREHEKPLDNGFSLPAACDMPGAIHFRGRRADHRRDDNPGLGPRHCGASGDGTTDDSGAFQTAFERAARASHAVVHIPAGSYRLDHLVNVAFAGAVGNGLTVLGDGQGVSVIHCNNANGALRIRNELCKTQVTIRDLTLLAARADAGTALEVSSSLRGVRNYRTLTVQNVDMRGEDLPTRKHFNRGLLALAQWRPIFENVIFGGILDPSLKQSDPAGDALFHKPEFGFAADWSYGAELPALLRMGVPNGIPHRLAGTQAGKARGRRLLPLHGGRDMHRH